MRASAVLAAWRMGWGGIGGGLDWNGAGGVGVEAKERGYGAVEGLGLGGDGDRGVGVAERGVRDVDGGLLGEV